MFRVNSRSRNGRGHTFTGHRTNTDKNFRILSDTNTYEDASRGTEVLTFLNGQGHGPYCASEQQSKINWIYFKLKVLVSKKNSTDLNRNQQNNRVLNNFTGYEDFFMELTTISQNSYHAKYKNVPDCNYNNISVLFELLIPKTLNLFTTII